MGRREGIALVLESISIRLSREDIAVRVVLLCNALGTQKELARKLCISESYLSDMINGRREYNESLLQAVGVDRIISYYGEEGWKP